MVPSFLESQCNKLPFNASMYLYKAPYPAADPAIVVDPAASAAATTVTTELPCLASLLVPASLRPLVPSLSPAAQARL